MGALFMALGRAAAAEPRMRDFNSQEFANTAWAFATLGHLDKQLYKALAATAEERMNDFNPLKALFIIVLTQMDSIASCHRASAHVCH